MMVPNPNPRAPQKQIAFSTLRMHANNPAYPFQQRAQAMLQRYKKDWTDRGVSQVGAKVDPGAHIHPGAERGLHGGTVRGEVQGGTMTGGVLEGPGLLAEQGIIRGGKVKGTVRGEGAVSGGKVMYGADVSGGHVRGGVVNRGAQMSGGVLEGFLMGKLEGGKIGKGVVVGKDGVVRGGEWTRDVVKNMQEDPSYADYFDARGHLTGELDDVPEKHRPKAKRPRRRKQPASAAARRVARSWMRRRASKTR